MHPATHGGDHDAAGADGDDDDGGDDGDGVY